jgi:chromosome segregation ATPase
MRWSGLRKTGLLLLLLGCLSSFPSYSADTLYDVLIQEVVRLEDSLISLESSWQMSAQQLDSLSKRLSQSEEELSSWRESTQRLSENLQVFGLELTGLRSSYQELNALSGSLSSTTQRQEQVLTELERSLEGYERSLSSIEQSLSRSRSVNRILIGATVVSLLLTGISLLL